MIKPGVFLIFAGLILAGVSFAGIAGSAGYPLEISHLLNFIERSGCIFMRNGGEYDSKEARDHIERKYGHTKSFADSTEQFIEYTATESSLSGSPYRVRCQGREMLSARWLLDELAEYRANHRVDSENQ